MTDWPPPGLGVPPPIEWVETPSPGPAGTPGSVAGEPLRAPRRRFGYRVWLPIVLVALVAAGVGVWFAVKPAPAVRITYKGVQVAAARQLVTQADAGLSAYAAANLGVTAKHARCYFMRDGDGVATDVDATLWCGPVLFFDGRAPAAYLRFPIAPAGPAEHDLVALTVAKQPQSPTPVALPANAIFVRPDHRTPPPGMDGLIAPIPPPAAPDLLEGVAADDIDGLVNAPVDALMGSRDYSVRLVSSGYVTHVGHGRSERSAAAGRRLFGFGLDLQQGEANGDQINIPAGIRPAVQLVVDGVAHALPIPVTTAVGLDHFYVASVPAGAKTLDLVIKNAGFTQRLSAVTGEPAAGNIAVLRTRKSFDPITAQGTAAAAVSTDGHTFAARLQISVYGFQLEFFTPNGPHPADPGHAFLYVSACYISPDFVDPNSCHTFRGTDLQLTPRGGAPIAGRDVGKDNFGYCVFEVPASFTAGTLTVTGSEASTDGWSMTITQPYRDTFHL